jgi:hypothetical protein
VAGSRGAPNGAGRRGPRALERARCEAWRQGGGSTTGTHGASPPVSSTGPKADAARAEFRALMDAKGHAVDNARTAVARLDAAFAAGDLQRTPTLDLMLADLMLALEQDEGQKLGGKSAEAARFILRAVSRELDNA